MERLKNVFSVFPLSPNIGIVFLFFILFGIHPPLLWAWEKSGSVIEIPPLGPEAVCTATQLYLRDKPSPEGHAIGKLVKGEIVKVVEWVQFSPESQEDGRQTIDGIDSYWFRIAAKNGKEGYVFGGYLEDIFSSIRSENAWALATLLSGGANVNAQKTSQQSTCGAYIINLTPLYLATELGKQKLVEYLIKSGADPNKGRWFFNDGTRMIESPLMLNLSTGIALILLGGGADPNQKTVDGRTPLSIAIEGDALNIASILLAHGADINLSLKDRNEIFLFHDSPALRKWLVAAKWSPYGKDSFGWTPLMHSVYNESHELTQFIRSCGSPEDGLWKAKFLLLSKTGTIQDIKKSISIIPSVDFDSRYGSPLAITLSNRPGEDGVDVAKLLLTAGARANGTGVHGNPLMCETGFGYESAKLDLLLDFGGDTRSVCSGGYDESSSIFFDKYVSEQGMSNRRLLHKINMAHHFGSVQPSNIRITEETAWHEVGGLLDKVKTVQYLIETRIYNDTMTVESTETVQYRRGASGAELAEGDEVVFRFIRNSKEAWLFNQTDTKRDHWSDPLAAPIFSPFPTIVDGLLAMGTMNSQVPVLADFHWTGLQMIEGEECHSFSTPNGNLWISRKEGLPRRMTIYKPMCAEILFKNARVNLPIDEKMFNFEPKIGTWYHENESGKPPIIMTVRPRLSTHEQEKLKTLFIEIDTKFKQLGSFSGKFAETSNTPIEGFLTFSKPYKIYFKKKAPGLPTHMNRSLDNFFMTDGYTVWTTLNKMISKEGTLLVSHKPLGNPQWFWEEIGGEPFQEPKSKETFGVKGLFQSNTSPRRGKKSGPSPIPLFMFRPFWGVDRDYAIFLGEETIQNNPTYKFLFYPDGRGRLSQNVETWIDKKNGFTRKWSEIDTTSNEVQRSFELSDVKVNINPPPELFRWAPRPGYVLGEE